MVVSAKLAALMSSAKQDWETPDVVLNVVRRLGRIELDPATTPSNPTDAGAWIAPPDDALTVPWVAPPDGVVYLNPPFKGIEVWVDKWVESAADGPSSHWTMLTPARTDTRWWRKLAAASDRLCLIHGRLTFKGAPGPAPFPCALWYVGKRPGLFEDAARVIGTTWRAP